MKKFSFFLILFWSLQFFKFFSIFFSSKNFFKLFFSLFKSFFIAAKDTLPLWFSKNLFEIGIGIFCLIPPMLRLWGDSYSLFILWFSAFQSLFPGPLFPYKKISPFLQKFFCWLFQLWTLHLWFPIALQNVQFGSNFFGLQFFDEFTIVIFAAVILDVNTSLALAKSAKITIVNIH